MLSQRRVLKPLSEQRRRMVSAFHGPGKSRRRGGNERGGYAGEVDEAWRVVER